MKLTNKILLSCLVIILGSVITNKVIILSKMELVPTIAGQGISDTCLSYNKDFSSLEVKGKYLVHVIRDSTKNEVKMRGFRSWIKDFTTLTKVEDLLRIESNVDLSKLANEFKVEVKAKEIKNVSASSGAIVILENFSGPLLSAAARDSSMIISQNCRYLNSQIQSYGNALVSINKTDNASIDLRNSGRLAVKLDKGVIEGTAGENTDLLIDGTPLRNKVQVVKLK